MVGAGRGMVGQGSGTGARPKTQVGVSTRSATKHYLFQHCGPMDKLQLPQSIDIIRDYYFRKSNSSMQRSPSDFYQEIINDLKDIWAAAWIPTISDKGIYMKLDRMFKDSQFTNIDASKTRNKTNSNYHAKIINHYSVLFNICKCKCYDKLSRIELWVPNVYLCSEVDKIRDLEDLQFLYDQIHTRQQVISYSIDGNATKKFRHDLEKDEKRQKRKREEEESLQRRRAEQCTPTSTATSAAVAAAIGDDSEMEVSASDQSSPTKMVAKKSRIDCPRTMEVIARFNIPIRAAHMLLNCHSLDLKDAFSLNIAQESLTMSRTQVQDQFNRACNKSENQHRQKVSTQWKCIKFDGTTDSNTLTENNRRITEKHCTFIGEPNGQYIDHITVYNETAASMVFELICLLREYDSYDSVRVLGCDATNVNTGTDTGGIICKFEEHRNSPVMWNVCLMHFLQLPLFKIFKYHDNDTKSKDTYKGPIGKKFNRKASEYPDPVKFEPITRANYEPFSEDFLKSLNKDRQLMFRFSEALHSGVYDPNLMLREIGKVHKARWDNDATSMMKQYMTDASPSRKLKRLCIVIQKWFIPFLQYLLKNWRLQDGAKCFWYGLMLATNVFEGKEITIYKETAKNNSYFAHPEWILLAGLCDQDQQIRQKAVNYILLDRQRRAKPGYVVRKFVKPTVNFLAQTYWDLCSFNQCPIEYITEPAITFDVSDDDLKKCATGEKPLVLPDIPIHSVNNERAVQATSIACQSYGTYEKRHSTLIMKLNCREKLPTGATKKHFT